MDGIYGSSVVGKRKTIQVGSLDGNESKVEAFKSTRTNSYPSMVRNEGREDKGRKAWVAIHSDRKMTAEKLLQWEDLIPGYECNRGCKKFYVDWKEANPPEFDENGYLKFEWGWRLHNAVNGKLLRDEMPLDKALAIWRPHWQ